MNNELTSGFIRHIITILAGAIMTNTTGDINEAVGILINNLTTGEPTALVGSSIAIFAILWSMWVKFSDESKQAVIKTLTFNKK